MLVKCWSNSGQTLVKCRLEHLVRDLPAAQEGLDILAGRRLHLAVALQSKGFALVKSWSDSDEKLLVKCAQKTVEPRPKGGQ